MVLEKIDEPGGKVDFTLVSPPRENAIERGKLPEYGVDDEPTTNNAGDEGGVEQGSKPLRHSSGDLIESVVHLAGTPVRDTSLSLMRGS